MNKEMGPLEKIIFFLVVGFVVFVGFGGFNDNYKHGLPWESANGRSPGWFIE